MGLVVLVHVLFLPLAMATIDDICKGTIISNGYCFYLNRANGKPPAIQFCESHGMILASMEEEDEFDRFMTVIESGKKGNRIIS